MIEMGGGQRSQTQIVASRDSARGIDSLGPLQDYDHMYCDPCRCQSLKPITLLGLPMAVLNLFLPFFPRSVSGLDKEADLVHMEVRTADGCECYLGQTMLEICLRSLSNPDLHLNGLGRCKASSSITATSIPISQSRGIDFWSPGDFSLR